MGLQVRLRHALGERVLELPERAVDSPIFVGRAADAEVQVPSIHVGLQHLVFFVHEGQWVVQAVPGSSGTSINGAPLAGARRLLAGDVLTLGPDADAPTLEVARAAVAPAAADARAHATQHGSADPAAGGYAPPHGGDAPLAVDPAAAAVAIDAHAYAPDSDGDLAGWAPDPTPPAARRYATPKRRNSSSDLAVALAVIVSLAIVVGAGVFIYLRRQKAAPPAPVAVAPKKTPGVLPPTSRPDARSIFHDRPVKPAPPADTKRPPPLPDPTDADLPLVVVRRTDPATTATRAASPPDDPPSGGAPAADASPESEKAFKRVESAYYDPSIAKALMTFDAYAQEFPGAHKKEIEQYREDALDKLWWDRIADLVQKRQELAAGIKKTEQEIKDETEAAYKKTVLEPKLENQKRRLAAAGERLTREMGYKLTTPPPLGKDAEMRALREQRDSTTYETWKARVLKHLRDTHGSFPWANER